MPSTYSQRSGEWRYNGELIDNCIAGNGAGKNNPAMQHVVKVGPIVRNRYTIGAPQNLSPDKDKWDHPHLGPFIMPLIPEQGSDMEGRGGFFIHGMGRSEGCIMPLGGLAARCRIDSIRKTDPVLIVTE